jgi:superfamily II DNA or RNA helicase
VVKIEKDGSGLNVKTIAGESIFGEKSAMDSRTKIVDELNAGQLDGIIMTAELGACGFNMIGACTVIFMGSMYSLEYERQVIGRLVPYLSD